MKALVLAGGFPQIALIKNLKKRGYFVILADWGDSPPAKPYADKFYQASTLDLNAIEKIAIDEKIDLLITVCTDQALNTVATLSEKLNLPCYIDGFKGKNVTNKRYMKTVFKKANIPSAKHTVCKFGDPIVDNFLFPSVVKPVDANSSKGVVKVYNQEQLEIAVNHAQEISRTNDAIIEEFIEGREFTVDAFVINKKSTVLCISEIQKISSETNFVICRTFLPPPNLSKEICDKISKVVQQIVDAFELDTCPLLVQLINRDSDVFVVEFSARTGGGEKYKSIFTFTGVDIIDATVDASLGITPNIKPKPNSIHLLSEFIYCNGGIIGSYYGFEEAKEKGYIDNYELFRNQGDNISDASSSSDRAAAVMFVADTHTELIEKYKHAIKLFKITDKNENDIMRKDITLL